MSLHEIRTAPVKGEDKFLTSAFKGKNTFWRYFVISITPFVVSNIIGTIILLPVIFSHASGGMPTLKGGMPDFESMGINLNVGFILTVFPFLLAFLTLVLLVKPLHYRTITSVINGRNKIRWGRIFVSAFIWCLISAAWLFYSIKADPGNFVLKNTSGSLITLAILAIVFIPFQAGFEEILFRGYLNQGFAVLAGNRWVPLIVTSLLFGLMHGLNPEVSEYGFFTMIPQYVFFGLVFSVLTLMDDGIELAIGAHTANNIFLSVFVTNKDSALQTPAMYEQVKVYPWNDFASLVIMSLVFVAVIAIIYRWEDIRRLFARVQPEAAEPDINQIP